MSETKTDISNNHKIDLTEGFCTTVIRGPNGTTISMGDGSIKVTTNAHVILETNGDTIVHSGKESNVMVLATKDAEGDITVCMGNNSNLEVSSYGGRSSKQEASTEQPSSNSDPSGPSPTA